MAARRPEKQREFFDQVHFDANNHSYVAEYDRWRKASILKNLIGVYEIPRNDYLHKTPEALLELVGRSGFTVVGFGGDAATEYYEPSASAEAQVAGCTCALKNPYGKSKSVIFMREDVLREPIPDPKRAAEVDAMGKLGTLIHEMGHAEDMEYSINYHYDTATSDDIGGEVYAHEFVLKHARRLGYQQVIYGYCRNLENDLTSVNDVYREAASRIWEKYDIPAIRMATGLT